MKQINIIAITLIASLTLAACVPTKLNLQVYSFNTPEFINDGEYVNKSESEISIAYNFWSSEGNPSVQIANITPQDITVDMSQSFIIINGLAYDFRCTENGNIPPYSTKIFTIPVNISSVVWLSSDLMSVYNEPKTTIYNENNTPITLRTHIAYTTSSGLSPSHSDYKFWVSSITNMRKKRGVSEVVLSQYPELYYPVKSSPNSFYNYYPAKNRKTVEDEKTSSKVVFTVRKQQQ